MTREQLEEYESYVMPLLEDERVQQMSEFIQHGNTTCLQHCEAVARKSAEIAYKYKIKVDMKSMVRGAILHDYFLYDWHHQKLGNFHGFYHPGIALKNAVRDFELNEIERDVIKKHMFPLTLYLPRYKETVVVCLADKDCTIREFFARFFKFKTIHGMS